MVVDVEVVEVVDVEVVVVVAATSNFCIERKKNLQRMLKSNFPQ